MTTREKILNASFDLLVDRGFHGTSTKLILEATKISNGSLYYHFSNKEKIVKAIYYNLKDEIRDTLLEVTKGVEVTKEFLWVYWKHNIIWALKNQRKKEFLEMYSKSTTIRDSSSDEDLLKFQFAIDKIKFGMEKEEIISQDIMLFIFNFLGSMDGLINYLEYYPEKNTEEFLKENFNQYWRSIVKF